MFFTMEVPSRICSLRPSGLHAASFLVRSNAQASLRISSMYRMTNMMVAMMVWKMEGVLLIVLWMIGDALHGFGILPCLFVDPFHPFLELPQRALVEILDFKHDTLASGKPVLVVHFSIPNHNLVPEQNFNKTQTF
ncbi:hypothetical protein [Alicyclobacillus ferrooxydans]|uniref:hypothetical protein n=1 Tax=Alicyclobacillus ferrooxydans TaxID=471514 RepID=UPI0012ED17F5|nr:hypothetical protein [Alicyclobacillus ferrooxydans]